jgi:hypothetical protein
VCGKDGELHVRGIAGILIGLEKIYGLTENGVYWEAVHPLVDFARDTQLLSAEDTPKLESTLYAMLEGYHYLSTIEDSREEVMNLLDLGYKHTNGVVQGIVQTSWTSSSRAHHNDHLWAAYERKVWSGSFFGRGLG